MAAHFSFGICCPSDQFLHSQPSPYNSLMTEETHQELLRTESVLSWSLNQSEPQTVPSSTLRFAGAPYAYAGATYKNLIVTEKHYTVAEIAEQWGISVDLARDTFEDEPGVLTFDRPRTRVKRGYSTMRIPESVLVRVHTRLTSGK